MKPDAKLLIFMTSTTEFRVHCFICVRDINIDFSRRGKVLRGLHPNFIYAPLIVSLSYSNGTILIFRYHLTCSLSLTRMN